MSVVKIKLKKGDKVIVVSGKHKGKTGVIKNVLTTENKVLIEGVNIAKKHQKPNKEHPQGAILDIEVPVWVSKVALYEPTSKKPSKVAYKMQGDKKVRVYKTNGKEVK